ncbi:hypothetical protein VTN77DRAFT_7779 [Rasamsonia byssochlamydoides]|uniref:uncharacterized protein n=1 Tax=Rasamsonia byssochlamydoides TaxID=89139 RepID=UPI003741EC2E
MGAATFIEPLMVFVLLLGGTWLNRDTDRLVSRKAYWRNAHSGSHSCDRSDSLESGLTSPTDKDELLEHRSVSPSLLVSQEKPWRKRELSILSWKLEVLSPNTAAFRHRLLSRLLRRFPFLVECWYWALVYWTYQLGRAFTAVTLKEDTVEAARKHALQLVQIERALGLFCELEIQHFFMRHPQLMSWTNWVYSFIHIPGTIFFLIWLYYYTTTRNRLVSPLENRLNGSPAGPPLYAARRRTMAVCNLLSFVVFTLWPCMPPRLLSDQSIQDAIGEDRSYGFVDTVHGVSGVASVWTRNRFCNQYAAMPSLHFGYSLMIGLTVMTIPLPPKHRRSTSNRIPIFHRFSLRISLPSWRRLVCVAMGLAYPLVILAAIIATANHFILDAVAGAIVCFLGWWGNGVILNLLPLEDCFLWLCRLHKPERQIVDVYEAVEDPDDKDAVRYAVLVR